jgi:hypothetical protein
VSAWTIDLEPHLNAAVATFDGERRRGALNAWGNSFPAEELPFGATQMVGGTPFRLPARRPGGCDSVEPLGQSLAVAGEPPPAGGIALLCCGEMGAQSVAVEVVGRDGRVEALTVTAPGAIVAAGVAAGEAALLCSHLHYPGDYDLGQRLAAVWRCAARFRRRLAVARLDFGRNPLFHLLAVTLLDCVDGNDAERHGGGGGRFDGERWQAFGVRLDPEDGRGGEDRR